jgi:hypothetical protein
MNCSDFNRVEHRQAKSPRELRGAIVHFSIYDHQEVCLSSLLFCDIIGAEVRGIVTMIPAAVRQDSDALAVFAALADHLPGDYLIVGPHASYIYHHRLMPISKMIDLRVRSRDLSSWQAALVPPWVVLTQIPTHAQVRSAARLARLEPTLVDTPYRRRRVINGLNFIAPEDWTVELLARASTQIVLSECAALLIAQRATLDWEYLAKRTGALGLGARLRGMVRVINREAGRPLLPLETIIRCSAPKSSRAARELRQLTAYLPPALRASHRPSIAPATVADVLRGLQARWKVLDAR